MAKSSESDTNDKNEKTLPQRVLEKAKQKEECPLCEKKYLYSGDSSEYDPIMYLTCLRCGYGFYENEQQRKYRQNKEDEIRNPWGGGFLVLVAMLVVILAINLDRRGELSNPQPTSFPTEQQIR